MLTIQNLVKKFGEKVAVNNLSLEVPCGKIFGFLGPNGAGKTTTIKMLAGIEKPTSGQVVIDEIDMLKNPIEAKKRLAYIADEPALPEYMTGIQYLNFVSDIFAVSAKARKEKIEEFSQKFDFFDALNDKISGYSHGMRQKLALISAFIHAPQAVILDEPLVGLDAKATKTLKNILKDYANQGKTVFYSTHVMDLAERFCDELAIINKGELIFLGDFEKLKAEKGGENSTLEDIFLEMTEGSAS